MKHLKQWKTGPSLPAGLEATEEVLKGSWQEMFLGIQKQYRWEVKTASARAAAVGRETMSHWGDGHETQQNLMPDVRGESDCNPQAHWIEWGLASSIEK